MASLYDDKKKKPIDVSTGQQATIQPQGTTPQQTPQSGSFQNINKFIQQNTQGAQRVATGLSSEAAKRTQSVREGIQSAKEGYQQKVAGAQSAETGGEGFIKSAIESARQGSVAPQENLQRFSNLREGNLGDISYDAEKLGQLGQQEKGALGYGQGLMTEQGRFSALQRLINRPSYTTGQQRLDQLLLQTTPGAKDTLYTGARGAIKDFGGLTEAETAAQAGESQRLQQRIQALKGLSDASLKEALAGETEELGAAASARRKSLGTQLETSRKDLDAAIKAGDFNKANEILKSTSGEGFTGENLGELDKMLGRGTLKNQFLQGMGDYEQKVLNTFGVGGNSVDAALNEYFRNTLGTINPQALLRNKTYSDVELAGTPEQQQAKALSQLAGQDLTSQYSNINELIGKELGPVTAGKFDVTGLDAAKPGLEAAYKNLQGQISKSREGAKQERYMKDATDAFYRGENWGLSPEQLKSRFPGMGQGYVNKITKQLQDTLRWVDEGTLSKLGYRRIPDQQTGLPKVVPA